MSDEVLDSMIIKSSWLKRFVAKKIAACVRKKLGVDVTLSFLDDIDLTIDADTALLQTTISVDMSKKDLQKLLKGI